MKKHNKKKFKKVLSQGQVLGPNFTPYIGFGYDNDPISLAWTELLKKHYQKEK